MRGNRQPLRPLALEDECADAERDRARRAARPPRDRAADRLEKIEHDESHQLIEEFMLAAKLCTLMWMKFCGQK